MLKPFERGFYAFEYERAGDFLMFLRTLKNRHVFMYFPAGKDPFFYLAHEDFDKAIQMGVLAFVEQVPLDQYDLTLSVICPQKLEKLFTEK